MRTQISLEGIDESYALAVEFTRGENPRAVEVIEREIKNVHGSIKGQIKHLVTLALLESSHSCRFAARRLVSVAGRQLYDSPPEEAKEVQAATQRIVDALMGASKKTGRKPAKKSLL